jgi:hypothetical protein
MPATTIWRDRRPREASTEKGRETTKLASSPMKPYLAELHQAEAKLEDTITLRHNPLH